MGSLLIVNDRPAVAVEAGADGVHVGQEDMPVAQVRELVGPDMLIGLSTHAPTEIDAMVMATRLDVASGQPRGMASVDYIGVGPVYATPTKPGRPAVGLELVRYAALHSRCRSSRSAASMPATSRRRSRPGHGAWRSCGR